MATIRGSKFGTPIERIYLSDSSVFEGARLPLDEDDVVDFDPSAIRK